MTSDSLIAIIHACNKFIQAQDHWYDLAEFSHQTFTQELHPSLVDRMSVVSHILCQQLIACKRNSDQIFLGSCSLVWKERGLPMVSKDHSQWCSPPDRSIYIQFYEQERARVYCIATLDWTLSIRLTSHQTGFNAFVDAIAHSNWFICSKSWIVMVPMVDCLFVNQSHYKISSRK